MLQTLGEGLWIVEGPTVSFFGDWVAHYPSAQLRGAPGLKKKRPDLSFFAELGGEPRPRWQGAIEFVMVGGSFAMDEAVFFHRPSKTALVCDLIQNHDPNAFSRWKRRLMKLDGLRGSDGSTPREWRATFIDRKTARAALQTILDWNPEQLILAHGPVFRQSARDIIASSLQWMT